jgi:putative transcriptional regulator
MNFTNRIRERRTAMGLTQKALAEAVGVSRRTIISVEQGRHEPTLSLAFLLARIFDVRIEELFSYASDQERT